MALYPVILAGGSGTRLWPLSRELYPKQFLTLLGSQSLLQQTVSRLDGMNAAPPLIVCNEEHRFLVAEHIMQMGKSPSSIILEPQGRNTAPALTLAALALKDSSADPVMLVMPSDHIINDASAFQGIVQQGEALAQSGHIVTFGIVPVSPETGYGYIKKGAVLNPGAGNGSATSFELASFVEKPDRGTAEQMLKTDEYLWNSGIFMMKASVWLQELERHRSDIAGICQEAHAQGHRDGDFFRPDPRLFASCPSESIDYAVMEPASGDGSSTGSASCVVLPLDSGWSDLGAWSTLWEQGKQDDQGNVIQGDVHASYMKDSLLLSRHRLLAAVGLEDVIVVETADAVLVAHKEHVQDVKALVSQLKAEHRPEQLNHRNVHRPWGFYETVDLGPRFQVKRLTINPGAALSLQMHHHRAEHWVVVRGTATVTIGDEVSLLTENQSTYVPVGAVHRLENSGSIPLEIIEVQTGSYLGEDDIVRLEDRYNRYK